MFTKNFYALLPQVFQRNTSATSSLPKIYNGTEGQTLTHERATNLIRSIFCTGSGTDPFPVPSGVGNNLSDEEALTSTNVFKDDAGYPSGELRRTVTSNTSHNIGMLILGSGSTPPTKDDYKLESFIGTDVLQCTNASNSINESIGDDATDIVTRTWTFQNVSDSPVTVKEVGLIGQSVLSSSVIVALFSREVLSNPVTIAPNAKYTFEINLTVG